MKMNISTKELSGQCGITLIRNIANKILNINEKPSETEVNEVLFYGGDNEEETKKIGLKNLFCIYYVLIHASRTIDVCVPSLVSDTIAKCLISVQQKDVRVRVTIHNSEDFHNLQQFAQSGIEVKVIKTAERLEHEFILIDACEKDAVAIIGSLDYETARVNCNRDTTLLTSECAVVDTLKMEFDRIWDCTTSKISK